MACVIKYHLRLGDILRCFPIAKYLASQGHQVVFECNPEYHDIFQCVDYVKPIIPGAVVLDSKRYDLQIFPDRYYRYRECKKTWYRYVYDLYPEFSKLRLKVEFTRVPEVDLKEYNLPEQYCLINPCGYSQIVKVPYDWIYRRARDIVGDKLPIYVLAQAGQIQVENVITAKRLSHLPGLITRAEQFITVNTASTVIAASVRSWYYHIIEPKNQQDDFFASNQVRLKYGT